MTQIFYNVPNAPGVPPMLRRVLTAVSTTQGIVAGINNTLQFFQGRPPLPQWGVFDKDFNSVLDVDSILGFSNQNQSNISDFPLQNGDFATYNKVVLPARDFIRVSKGGSLNDRAALLRQVEVLYQSMEKFTIVTPEKPYLNVNIENYEVTRRDKDGAFFFTEIDIFFREIKSVAAVFTNTTTPGADTTNARNPAAQPPANQGVVQPATPSNAAQNEATTVLAGGAP